MKADRLEPIERPKPAHRRQQQTHLATVQREELVKRYVAGEGQAQLAEAFGVHAQTVARITEQAGVKRSWAMTDAEKLKVAARHAEGWSPERIGKDLGRSPETVRNVLNGQKRTGSATA
jgi:DNA-directed RNA polymerase specialized sigma24 family protein